MIKSKAAKITLILGTLPVCGLLLIGILAGSSNGGLMGIISFLFLVFGPPLAVNIAACIFNFIAYQKNKRIFMIIAEVFYLIAGVYFGISFLVFAIVGGIFAIMSVGKERVDPNAINY